MIIKKIQLYSVLAIILLNNKKNPNSFSARIFLLTPYEAVLQCFVFPDF